MSTKSHRDFRPKFHYAPPQGWINDPNGLTYADGQWHLFAQHYPHDTVWGPMHWIHAVSDDLLGWQDAGIALVPDDLGYIFSGSAVIDRGNTSGLGKQADPMICMYTSHGEHEQQSIAFSEDRVHFTPYAQNPVIPNADLPDFRDPKLFRNEILNCWSAVIAAGDHVEFYASDDLIHWRKTGAFGARENLLGGVFECPDVLELTALDGSTVWILMASMALPREFGGSRTQYFIGEFDGNTFVQTVSTPHALLIDSGFDNYAAVSFSGAKSPVILGWGASWSYADRMPTNEFCGLMTCARRVSLAETIDGLRLAFHPIMPKFALRDGEGTLPGEVFCVRVEADGPFTLSLSNDLGESLRVGLDTQQHFYVDRTNAGIRDFHDAYSSGLMSVTSAPRLKAGKAILELYFDRCIAETFADEGTFANSALVFPNQPYSHAEIFGNAKIQIGTPIDA